MSGLQSIPMAQLALVLVAAVLTWSVLRPRGPFSN